MSERPTILVVEDDDAIREGIVDTLVAVGYEVISASDGAEGMQLALHASYQLMLLDLIMPHHTGFEILKALQESRPGQATIILSARGEENDRVKGLSLGADDYVVKPFSLRELLARVDAVLRRSTERAAVVEMIPFGEVEVDLVKQQVLFANGEVEELSETEVKLLRYFENQKPRPISREELLRQVWGLDPKGLATRTIDMHVARLRQKLRDADSIVTVRGKGYRLGGVR